MDNNFVEPSLKVDGIGAVLKGHYSYKCIMEFISNILSNKYSFVESNNKHF